MADDKTRKGPQDANRISLSEDYEVQYWTNRFSVSRERLEAAVQKVGNGVDQVSDYLNTNTD